MGFRFPFVNLQELNLDWVLSKVKSMYDDTKTLKTETEDLNRAVRENIESVESAIDAVNDAVYAVDNLSVESSTLSPGSSATVVKSTVDGHINLAFGIPQGEQGIPGQDGQDGAPGTPATDAQVQTAVNTWLSNNVDPDSGYVLDSTLTQPLAAAPADAVGDIKAGIALEFDASQNYPIGRYVWYQGGLYYFYKPHAANDPWSYGEVVLSSVGGGIRSALHDIADYFSESTSYTEGDYVIYQQNLYRFTADHTAGAWNASHVVQVSLADDVSDLKSISENNFNALAEDNEKAITQFAPDIALMENGFINTSGIITSNSRYKTNKYIIPVGAKSVSISYIYVAGTGADYSVISAFDENDQFLSALNNNDVSPNSANTSINNWDLPTNSSYIKVTFGNTPARSWNVTFSGIFNYPKTKYVFNGVEGSANWQWYFHVPVSSLAEGTKTVALNAKFKFPVTPTNYQIYLVTYDSGYTNRTIIDHYDTNTRGIDGNNVLIAINFWKLGSVISNTAAYAGILLNFTLPDPITSTAASAMKKNGSYRCESEYCLINGVQVTTNYYYDGAKNSYVHKPYSDGYNPMLGGRLCCLGDSLTAVYYKDETESWPYLIAKWNSMSYDNLGVSGCPLANDGSYQGTSISERVDNLAASKFYTHIFVMAGANDYNLSIPIGENTDTAITTFKGAVNHTIDKLTEKYPFAKIVFATTYCRTSGRGDKPYADAMLEVCKRKSIPCLNNYEGSGVQMLDSDWMSMYGADGTTSNKHLNAAGDLFIAPRFENALKYGVDNGYTSIEIGDTITEEQIDALFI